MEISKYFINLDEITKPLRDDLEDARSGIGDSPEDFPGADAGGFRIGVRPVRMQIGDGVIQFGCIFQPSFGGGVFGKYGPTHVTIGVDSTNSPLAISPPDSEQSRVRAHLLEWMEFTNLEFELVPMSLRPWIKVVWEYDSEFPESVASTEGFWDNGVRIRLNPNLSWRTVDDIPSFQPDGTSYAYDFYVTHSLGHALGIRGELNPAIQDGAVMLPITDPGRYDYRLRPRDVRAVQDTFGARPIPFQPQVLDATQLEAAMKNALQAVGDDHVTYRMDEKQRIAEGRKAFSASLSATLDGIWFHAHEDSGKSEYQVETIIGVCGKNTSLKQNWLSGIKDEQGTIALEHPPVTITADLNVMRDIIGRNAGEDLWVFLHVNVLGIDNPSVGDSHDPWGSWDGEIREAAHNGGRIVPFSVPFREALNGNTPAGAYFEAYFSKAIVLAHFKSVANLSFRFQVPTALWPFHIAETARYAQEQALQAALPDAIYLPVEESAP